MSIKFTQIAKDQYYQVENLPNGEEILFGAILYLRRHAIPPLKGNYTWFSNSLMLILEICNPNHIVIKDNVPFLLSMQKGLVKQIEQAIQEN